MWRTYLLFNRTTEGVKKAEEQGGESTRIKGLEII